MSWFRTATCWWVVSGLLLVGGVWFGVALGSSDAPLPPAWLGPGFVAVLFYAMALLVGFTQAVLLTVRKVNVLMYRRKPERVGDLVAQLDSAGYLDRARALQTLADLYREPFGPIDCRACSPAQLDALSRLYREWWRAERESGAPPPEAQREALLRRVVAQVRALRDAAELSAPLDTRSPLAEPALARLPCLPPGEFVAALRPRVEDVLLRVAAVINQACQDIPFSSSEYRARRLFTWLCWEAFERGWRMRFDAADRRLLAARAESRPSPVAWAEKYRRMNDPEAPGPAPEGLMEPAGRPGEMTWGELAAALHRKVDETLDRLNEAIKDALIDGELPDGAEDDYPNARPLVPLVPERFVEAMRPRIEDALRGMADSLNESGGADRVGALLEALLRDALQTGLEMRGHPDSSLFSEESSCGID